VEAELFFAFLFRVVAVSIFDSRPKNVIIDRF